MGAKNATIDYMKHDTCCAANAPKKPVNVKAVAISRQLDLGYAWNVIVKIADECKICKD